ncbi:MAG: hypothetical protein ABJB78_04495 [Betaproteobacteria bacterium]
MTGFVGTAGAGGAAGAPDALAAFRRIDPAVATRLPALDPERLSAADVRETLAHAPAPRIIALSGSVALVTMEPFAMFLAAMGYPRERLANPGDGSFSYSSYTDSVRLAGEVAWFYEHDAMMPMLIGHSQGGMLVLRTLHELAGTFGNEIRVWPPRAEAPQQRTTIVDPLTGRERPVAGLEVGYAAALATGKLPRVLLLQWSMLPHLRAVPDTVTEFGGYSIPGDLIAGNLFGDEPYRALGTASVRNVTLPATYSHVGLPRAAHLATDPATREWIDRYTPGTALPVFPDGVATDNLLHAADIWYAVKKRWCIEAQRALRAAQAR